jgi:hypothetical protein
MLRPGLLVVASPVGDPEVNAGFLACDLLYLDPDSHLPQRILECWPAKLEFAAIEESALAATATSEFTVHERHSNGVPVRATWHHKARALANYEWTCRVSGRLGDSDRPDLADASVCPVRNTEHPITRTDLLLNVAETRKHVATEPDVSSAVWETRQGVSIRSIGAVMALVGAMWALLRNWAWPRIRASAARCP